MINLVILEGIFSICKLDIEKPIPSQVFSGEFYSVTRTDEEISVIVREPVEFQTSEASEGWMGFRVEGILDFSLTGIINSITEPLKDNKISVFVTSTYNTDYIFVREDSFEKTVNILKNTPDIKLINY